MKPIDHSPRPASGALTSTGGFLTGFTHTLQPYIGCQFACEYCYVKGLSVHHFHQPKAEWGMYAHPRIGLPEKLRAELTKAKTKGVLDTYTIFMSSATDPYQAIERKWRLTRACLDVMCDLCPKLLIIQTRSPFVVDDFERLRRLRDRCWLNFTLETDQDDARKAVTPLTPSIAQRLRTLKHAMEFGLNVQITVSPCLPFSTIDNFGALLITHSHRIVVDTFTSGDGMKGRRTANTKISNLYQAQGWQDWRSEESAHTLYLWLQARIGDRVGWSQAGFTELTLL